MNNVAIKESFKSATKTLAKYSPQILTGLSVVGTVVTAILAVRATPKAEKKIEEMKRKTTRPLTYGDVVKAAWKCYIPAGLTGAATIACTIGSNTISNQRIGALTSACVLSERAFSEYKAKVKEEIGEKKEKKIHDEIAKDKVQNAYSHNQPIVITGNGDSLYMEEMTGQLFRSSRTAIDKAVIHCTAMLQRDDWVSYSDFLDQLGLRTTVFSDNLGWDSRDMKEIEPIWSHPIYGDQGEGEPCGVISFNFEQMSGLYHDHVYG